MDRRRRRRRRAHRADVVLRRSRTACPRSRRCGSAAPARTAASPPIRRCRAGRLLRRRPRGRAAGAVQLAYTSSVFGLRERAATLRASSGVAGQPLPAPGVLARGGKGVNAGSTVAAAFPAAAARSWRGSSPATATRRAGRSRSSWTVRGRSSARRARSAVAWRAGRAARRCWAGRPRRGDEVHVATRPQAGGPFGPDVKLADSGSPSVAMTPAGEALARLARRGRVPSARLSAARRKFGRGQAASGSGIVADRSGRGAPAASARSVAGEVPLERLGDLVVAVLEVVERAARAAVSGKSLGSSSLRWMIEW